MFLQLANIQITEILRCKACNGPRALSSPHVWIWLVPLDITVYSIVKNSLSQIQAQNPTRQKSEKNEERRDKIRHEQDERRHALVRRHWRDGRHFVPVRYFWLSLALAEGIYKLFSFTSCISSVTTVTSLFASGLTFSIVKYQSCFLKIVI